MIANDFPLVQLLSFSCLYPLLFPLIDAPSFLPLPFRPSLTVSHIYPMPGVVENEQARRISKSIDDDLKVGFLDYVARFILPPPPPSPFT